MKITEPIFILGIDPGSINLGYGVVCFNPQNDQQNRSAKNQQISYVAHGVITNPKLDPNQRLAFIRDELDLILEKYRPQMAAIEKVFLGKNPQSVFRLGLARGVAISCISRHPVEIFEYSPTQMKKMMTGSGHAAKETVARAVKNFLQLDSVLEFDAADALGLAYVHAREYSVKARLSNLVRL